MANGLAGAPRAASGIPDAAAFDQWSDALGDVPDVAQPRLPNTSATVIAVRARDAKDHEQSI